MTAKKQRMVLRLIHLGISLVLGLYVYAPPEETGDLRAICQWILFPALTITGLWMWQQRRVNRLLRLGKPARPQVVASQTPESV